MKKIVGIYKITSPSGKVYIGQSANVLKRLSYYKNHGCSRQPKLYASLSKYGFSNHTFQIIHEFPFDVDISIVHVYEILYIEQYRSCGVQLLNLTDGGEGSFNPSESSREKMRKAQIGRVISPLCRERSAAALRGKEVSKETREKRSKSLKGRPSPFRGRKHTAESRSKMGTTLGKKKSAEDIQKRLATIKKRKCLVS